MNLANKLTLARICIVPLYILLMELGGFIGTTLALFLFTLASITDFFDGKIARRNKTVTSLGIFLDPLADKMLISTSFICFTSIPFLRVPAWMVVAIIAREYLITGLRSIAAYKNIMIPADKTGKFKTTFQIVAILLISVILILNEYFIANPTSVYLNKYFLQYANFVNKIPFWITFTVVVFTVTSGLNYMRKYRGLLNEK
ncbi:MAG: CDP-diacylglycerol--glycerol-3-phosphate 3-phosphatidyltransferase [Endomicrobium sp.]|jgi:CDP-diacylglycerol--glycerol-3-phosphate 3-phosphatidyltransferase|uniref:CDP-diacylglycerol--glycerol-3-phosphate 3-phosphatidyltransferase n=1 Tax=Candidatus Endomicrobiellum cubanum TaxID=3242325 RepID=UPI0028326EA7|nr:CDP-diacylglycerol--glycerol-3-phosphate 3-phosphatidyltransferase [Endomicrobium sp.]MDR2395169.1 CDP-diacylglycerol--glycerol-3-phosphate 3-phosphatidyltransferase [Endomicrobium sp.]